MVSWSVIRIVIDFNCSNYIILNEIGSVNFQSKHFHWVCLLLCFRCAIWFQMSHLWITLYRKQTNKIFKQSKRWRLSVRKKDQWRWNFQMHITSNDRYTHKLIEHSRTYNMQRKIQTHRWYWYRWGDVFHYTQQKHHLYSIQDLWMYSCYDARQQRSTQIVVQSTHNSSAERKVPNLVRHLQFFFCYLSNSRNLLCCF